MSVCAVSRKLPRSFRLLPCVSITGCATSRTRPGNIFNVFAGQISCVPTTVTGKIGIWASIATRKAPILKGRRIPSGLRVPSGKNKMPMPLPRRSSAALICFRACSGFFLSMKIWPTFSQPIPMPGVSLDNFCSVAHIFFQLLNLIFASKPE